MVPSRGRPTARRWLMAGVMAAALLPVTPAFARAESSSADGSRADASHAKASAACTQRVSSTDRSTSWAAPLDRIVSVQLPDTTLRDAIDRVARAARVELSYSSDFLPARRVCLALDRVAVGAALESLLEGTTLRAVVISATQVVLAPVRG